MLMQSSHALAAERSICARAGDATHPPGMNIPLEFTFLQSRYGIINQQLF
jgi:hypothetical protein